MEIIKVTLPKYQLRWFSYDMPQKLRYDDLDSAIKGAKSLIRDGTCSEVYLEENDGNNDYKNIKKFIK